MKNENIFIREVTQALYSSLEIEKSLHEAVSVLKKYLPINLIHAFVIDTKSQTLRYLAEATEKQGILIDEKITIPEQNLTEIRSFEDEEIFILESPESPLLRMTNMHFQNLVKKPLFPENSLFSVMILNFRLGSSTVCGFGIVSKGTEVFNEKHIKMMELIRKPVTGSVINLLNYRDLVCRNERLYSEKQELEKKLSTGKGFDTTGKDKGLSEVMEMISQVAALNSPVLITGETGTGKEIAASELHRRSARKDGPMIKINCGAIPETLIDSELFGHEKGAFTGASSLKRGYFEQADGGTIFLDEIGDLPMSAQVRLLRVLQTMEFTRIGGSSSVSVDVRVVAATNKNLFEMTQENRFRADLWFRLNVFPIKIPPLRERKSDIKNLAQYFTNVKTKEMNRKEPPQITDEAAEMLTQYSWPGNVRELENIIERALILGRGESLMIENPEAGFLDKKSPENKNQNKKIEKLDELIKNHIEKALEHADCRISG
ncbi:MAG: sigma-54 interaction domain-containing protein, partial [Thermodesulfobacteriota bacterium]